MEALAMSIDELLRMFLAAHAAANHSPRTIEWYRAEVMRFFAWLRANNLHNGNWLRPQVIELYLASDRADEAAGRKGNSPFTIAGHWRALKGFFGWLVEREYIDRSPIDKVPQPKTPDHEPRRVALEDYLLLLDSIPQGDWIDLRDRLIVTTFFLCGLRREECAGLEAKHYRTGEHLLRVRGKGDKDRLVPLLPAVERAFVVYLFARPAWPDARLLLAANGAGKPNGVISGGGIYQMLRRRSQAAGLATLNPHAFRHGLAMYLLNEGGDMSLVQKVLGHSQIATTAKHYAQWLTQGMMREFAEKMKGLGQ
jgi:integrase/recombinase XerC